MESLPKIEPGSQAQRESLQAESAAKVDNLPCHLTRQGLSRGLSALLPEHHVAEEAFSIAKVTSAVSSGVLMGFLV